MKISEKLGAVSIPDINFITGEFAPPIYICQRATTVPVIDGDLLKPFWEGVDSVTGFRDMVSCNEVFDNDKTAYVKLQWDNENLYIGAHLADKHIWAHVTERDDAVCQDNDFEFYLDGDGSSHNYFQLEVNALGTIRDLFMTKPPRDGGTAIDGFCFRGIEAAVKIVGELNNPEAFNQHWNIEIKIPWKGVPRYGSATGPPKLGDYMRFNLSRAIWRTSVDIGKYVKEKDQATGQPFPPHYLTYAPTGVSSVHYPELWAFLVFSDRWCSFDVPIIEKIRWELRKIYYSQREFFSLHGRYAEGSTCNDASDSSYTIKTEITRGLFHTYCEHGGYKVNIIHDGYTWIEKV